MITKFLPTFKVVEVNNLTGLRNGHVLAQFPAAATLTKKTIGTQDFYENGIFMSLGADGTLGNYNGVGFPILHYTEELNTVVNGLKYFATPSNEFPRGIMMYIGDTITTNNVNGVIATATHAKLVDGVVTLQKEEDNASMFVATPTTLPDGSPAVSLLLYSLPSALDVSTWTAIQKVVRTGMAPETFPIGTELTAEHDVYGDLTFVVVEHDHLLGVTDPTAHTMTLGVKDTIASAQYDAPEAFYVADEELVAGTYNITLAETYESWLAETYEFTLTENLPVGGQLTISGDSSSALETLTVVAYADSNTTTPIETAVITVAATGTSLGEFGNELNHVSRVAYGSGNYAESAIRQLLNSYEDAGDVWAPQTKYDRPPTWVATLRGFKGALDTELIDVIGTVSVPCAANSVYESPDSITTVGEKYVIDDDIYLLSRNEVFGTADTVADDSIHLSYYEDVDNRKKADVWYLRTSNAPSVVRSVDTDGAMDADAAEVANSFVPAFTII